MNQDQIKNQLLKIETTDLDFSVLLTGKESKKVDGLYKPDTREIVIHNKNHPDDNAIMYTAIHEYAHHVQFTRLGKPVSPRVHTGTFWTLFHGLLDRAEELGIYRNVFTGDRRFQDITGQIKEHILSQNGSLMLEFGKLLMEAHRLCCEVKVSFEDYCDRCLGLRVSAARQAMGVFRMNISPDIGYENMKMLASIKDDATRGEAEQALRDGMRLDQVKRTILGNSMPDNPMQALMAEKGKTEQAIGRLLKKLAVIEERIKELGSVGEDAV